MTTNLFPSKSYAKRMPPLNGKKEEVKSSFFFQPQVDNYIPAGFQVSDLSHLEERDWSANWSEMGCYKTSSALWLIERKLKYVENPKVLIITTRTGKGTYFKLGPSILPAWTFYNVNSRRTDLVLNGVELKTEFPTEFTHPTLVVSHYNVFSKRKPKKPKKDEVTDLDEMIRLYGTKHNLDLMKEIEWDIIILDEAHRIKGRKTGWTIEIKKLKAKFRHVMTGTGFINRPDEVWSLFHFMNKRVFSSYWKFRERYCEEEEDWTGYKRVVGINPEHKDEFRQLIRQVGVRRTKTEVFKNLPSPIFSPVEVELSNVQRDIYNSIKSELYALDQKGIPLYSPNVLSALQRLRQICVATPEVVRDYYNEEKERRIQEVRLVEPSSKLDALMDIIEGLEWDEERRDQLVVFSNFKDPITLAKARFDKKGISYIHMEEKDNDRVRFQKWNEEFPKKEHQVFISTLQLGSESIDLTPATTCVFLDRSWSPKDNEQGVARVWRPGQNQVANIIHVNAQNTTDQRIEQTNIIKMGWFHTIFGEEAID